MKLIFTLALFLTFSTVITAQKLYQVKGRYLTDPCGDTVVLRGVNKMTIWRWDFPDGLGSFKEIAKTGANCVRIVWDYSGTADQLNTALTACENEKMIPVIELHDDDPADFTNEPANLPLYTSYWTKPAIVAVLKAHQSHILLNIVNELGTDQTTLTAFVNAYKTGITALRNADLHMPLIIDGSTWGQDIDMLENAGPVLTPYDPDHNIIYSVHLYWQHPWATDNDVTNALQASVTNNLPLIVGEFCRYQADGDSTNPVSYTNIMEQCQKLNIGYIAWEWGPGNLNGNTPVPWVGFTEDGLFSSLHWWGYEVAINNINGIQKTSKKSHYLLTDSCADLLPVTLLSLNGENKGKYVLLNWATAAEQNNTGFEVQRSTDGYSFSKMAFVASKAVNGNSNAKLEYNYNDNYPIAAAAYYRLKQLDKDGRFTYSNITIVKGDNSAGPGAEIIYPNPVKSTLNIKMASRIASKITLLVSDASGRVMINKVSPIATGESIMQVNVGSLPAGTYFLKIVSGNNQTTVRKFIKE